MSWEEKGSSGGGLWMLGVDLEGNGDALIKVDDLRIVGSNGGRRRGIICISGKFFIWVVDIFKEDGGGG